MPTIAEALRHAVELHQSNRLQEAADLYQRILQADPSVADAWHLLGVLLHQAGQNEQAAELIGAAIARDPFCAAYHDNLGSVSRAVGQAERAAACHRRAIALDPQASKPLGNLGNALVDASRRADAAMAFRRAVQLAPGQDHLRLRLADALLETGAAAEAEPLYEGLCAVQPDRADLRYRLGISRLTLSGLPASTLGNAGQTVDRERMRQAISCFEQAGQTGHAEAQRNLFGTTILALQNGVLDDATLGVAALAARRHLMAQPRDAAALSVVCYDLYRRKRLATAERFYRKHARLAPPDEAVGDFEMLLWSFVRGTSGFFNALNGYDARIFRSARRQTLVPRRDDGRPVVLVGCDDVYWQRFGAAFLASWWERAGACALHVHIINPADATVDALVRLGGDGGLSVTCERLGVEGLPDPVRRTYFASARFNVAKDLLRSGDAPILQVDVDAVFLADPMPSLDTRTAWDIAIMQDRRGRGPTRDFLAGFMAFNATPSGRAFLDRVVAYIGWHFDHGRVYWTLDQAAPYCVHDWMARTGAAPAVVWHDFEAFPYLRFAEK